MIRVPSPWICQSTLSSHNILGIGSWLQQESAKGMPRFHLQLYELKSINVKISNIIYLYKNKEKRHNSKDSQQFLTVYVCSLMCAVMISMTC